MTATIVVHGGAGAPISLNDGCEAAAAAAAARLSSGGDALDAAVEAVVVLENDGRFNAGSGAVLRVDGETVELDAGVMDSTGRLGAVAAVRRVRNPVLVARRVADTPHTLLAGEGATAFAKAVGLEAELAPSERARERHRRLVEHLASGGAEGGWSAGSLEEAWNLPAAYDRVFSRGGAAESCDTVGAVVRGPDGAFAVAGSTGGSVPMLLGRVGDTPLVGCGFYAGEHGAVACTGIGEEIARRVLAREVYDLLRTGMTPQAACEVGVNSFPAEISVGVIAVRRDGAGAASNREMARAFA